MKNKTKGLNGNTLLLFITIALFVVMYAVGCMIYADKGFTHLQVFLNLFITNAGLICIACGMTCVMLTGGIDISVGSMVAMYCMLLAWGMGIKGLPCIPMVLLVLVIGVLFGAIQGFLVGYLDIQPFIVTMAGLFFGRGMTAVICTDQISITDQMNAMFYSWANAKINLPAFMGYVNKKGKVIAPFIRPTVLVALACVIIIFVVLRYTTFGRSLYAVGGNEQSARMMGLNTRKTKMKAYILCDFLTAVGAICYCLNTMSGSVQQARGFEMDAIASSVIGGTLLTGGVGNVVGSMFGAMINGTITQLVTTNGKLLSSWTNIMTAALLMIFIVLQSLFAYLKNRNK